jgi:hypothetical protein
VTYPVAEIPRVSCSRTLQRAGTSPAVTRTLSSSSAIWTLPFNITYLLAQAPELTQSCACWPCCISEAGNIGQFIAFILIAGDAGETGSSTAAGLWPIPGRSAVGLANPARAVAQVAPKSPGPEANDHAGATGANLVGARNHEISFATSPVTDPLLLTETSPRLEVRGEGIL